MKEYESLDKLRTLLKNANYMDYLDCIDTFANSKDYSIRKELAVILSDYRNQYAERTLIKLTNDRNYIVQVEALDSLSLFCSKDACDALLSCFKSRHPMVRGYAYLGFAWICYDMRDKNAINCLNTIRERNSWANVNLRIAKILSGDSEIINIIKKAYPKYGYLNRIRTLNGFNEIIDCITDEERKRIIDFLESLDASNMDLAEREAYERIVTDVQRV